MNITELTFKNSRIALVILVVIVVLGVTGYLSMPRDSMPPYTVRLATVVTQFPGADPSRVEALVTNRLEEVIQEMPEVKTIESESRSGLSVITVELQTTVDASEMQAVWDRMKSKIAEVKPTLPDGIHGPLVKDEDIGQVYGIILGLTREGVPYNTLEKYAKQIRNRLIRLPDAAKVVLGGVQEERLFIEYDEARLAQYNLTAPQLKRIMSSTNILFPGGTLSSGRKRLIVEPSGNYETLTDIGNTLIPVKGEGSVFLKDIVTIYKDYIDPKESIVKVNGTEAISLSISLKDGANIIQLGKDIDRAIEDINSSLPLGMELERVASQDETVDRQIGDFVISLGQSIAIVLVVMLLFLGIRTGTIVAALVPLTMLVSLFLMNLFGIGLNKVSLAALIMSLGLLVDNGIVMAESILIRTEEGESIKKACIESSKILIIPLLISTLTTSSAFLSFFLANTAMGELASPLFSVVTIALLSSWVISFTFIPLLALYLVKTKKKEPKKSKKSGMDRLNLWYNRLLVHVLKKPLLFLIFIVALFVASLVTLQFLPFKLVPDSDRNLVTVDVKYPSGTKIEITEEGVASIEQFIKDLLFIKDSSKTRGILSFSSYIGIGPEPYDLGFFKDEPQSSFAHMLLNTTGDVDNDYVIQRLTTFCDTTIAVAEVRINRLAGAGATSTPVEIRISGPDPNELTIKAKAVKEKLLSIKGTRTIVDDWGPEAKKVVVDIDEVQAKRAGLTNSEIAYALQAGLSGMRIGNYREGEKSIPIMLRNENSEERNIQTLHNLTIFSSATGNSIPLQQVATVRVEWQFSKLKRKELIPTMTVGAYLDPGVTAKEIFKSISPWLEEQSDKWGEEYSYELGGEDENTNENLGAIASYLPISAFLILFLLVMQFNSYRRSLIIVATIPLGAIGVVFGWVIAGSVVSFFGVLGVIALAGILINDSIVLLDRIEVELTTHEGMTPQRAILAAANHKFRPVILTTLTTSLGMIPLWFGGGVLWQPLAVAIIFGLFFATVIILLFVPVLYRMFFKVSFKDFRL